MAENSINLAHSKTVKRGSARTASKTAAIYWQSKVYLEKKPGWTSSTYYVRIQVRKERRKFVLKATTKEAAGREALELYLKVLTKRLPGQ